MRNLTTNLALLMEWARVTPKELNRALGIDPSLISRWRTGSRRLPAGSRWCGRLTEYFLQVRRDEVTALMARVSPLGLSQGQPAEELLERWLGESMGSWEDRDALLALSRNQGGRGGKRLRPPDAGPLSGDGAVRKLLVEFLDGVLAQPGSGEIVFFCSEGLELYTGRAIPPGAPGKAPGPFQKGEADPGGAAHQLPARRCGACLRPLAEGPSDGPRTQFLL